MNDRELLEFAAKAAGFNFYWSVEEPSMIERLGRFVGSDAFGGMFVEWNPLTNDDDAFRLAVKLSMDICFGANYVIVRGSVQMPTVNNSDDPYAATRRAIVRAAAEIGRLMP